MVNCTIFAINCDFILWDYYYLPQHVPKFQRNAIPAYRTKKKHSYSIHMSCRAKKKILGTFRKTSVGQKQITTYKAGLLI